MYGFDDGLSVATLRTTHGYQFNQTFFLGIGTGVYIDTDFYAESNILVPLYGAIRFQGNHKTVIPFIDFKAGYLFNTIETEYCLDGCMFNPSIGINVVVANNMGVNISIGYNLYHFTWDSGYSWDDVDSYDSHSLSFSVGLEF